jgi:hypothetical protein
MLQNGRPEKEGAPVLGAQVNPFLLQPRWEERPPEAGPQGYSSSPQKAEAL